MFVAILGTSGTAPAADVPAPATDRVGFPTNYQAKWKQLRAFDDADDNTAKVVYANDAAASRKDGAYPYGAMLIIETWSTVQDAQNKTLRRKDKVTGLHVMRKERDFGQAYGENRTGEWEYVEYRLDGSYLTAPAASAKCASCHLKAGVDKDFVFGGHAKK